MNIFISLILCVILLSNLSNSDNVSPRQYQIFHQHPPTRIPAIFNRIRERLTSRPTHTHYHHPNIPNYWQILHYNLHQLSTLNTTSNFIIPTLVTLTNKEISTTNLPTSTTLQPEVNSITITSPVFTTTSSKPSTATTTLSPVKQSEIVTPPSFLTATSKSATESTTQPSTMSLTDSVTQSSSETTSNPSTSTSSSTTSTSSSTTSTSSSTTVSTTSSSKTSTSPATQSTTSTSTSTQKTISSSASTTQVILTTKSIPSTTSEPNLCANRTALYRENVTIAKLCYIVDSLTWQEARSRCLSMNYRIFEPNTMDKELAIFKLIKFFASINQFFWMNAKADIVASVVDWYAYDPYQVWNYTTTSWYRLVDAPVPGMCLGIIYLSTGPKFTSMNCESFHATFWCEYS